jgi:hypothetical protein
MSEKYFCRKCENKTNHKIIFTKETGSNEPYEEDYSKFSENYHVIECLGCESISFLKLYGDPFMIRPGNNAHTTEHYFEEEIFPLTLQNSKVLEELWFVPITIKEIYLEMILAFKSKALRLTAAGQRATIEAICNHLKIKKETLAVRIDLLHTNGYLSLKESKRLHSIRFLGNDAVHEIEKPSETQLHILLNILNHLISNLFIHDQLLHGNLETMISEVDEMIDVINNNIHRNMIGGNYSAKSLLGKSFRRIKANHFLKLEGEFLEKVKKNKLEYLKITENNMLLIIDLPPFF